MKIPTNVRYDGDIGDVRRGFEAWHCEKFKCKHSTGAPTRDMHGGVYDENYGPEHQQLMWEAWQAGFAAAPQLPDLNDDLREILGRICHTCIAISQVLRLMGHDIKRRAEDEQAATIHWLLGHYMRDTSNWRANASNELRVTAEKHKAANAADQGEVGTYPQEGL